MQTTDYRKSLDYRDHARSRPLQALAVRAFARYRPWLAGYVHGIVEHEIEKEEKRVSGLGMLSLAHSAVRRLNERRSGMEKWRYTRRHCTEVGFLSFIIASEAKKEDVPDAYLLDPEVCFVGGILHDIGKTLIPLELMGKELGIKIPWSSMRVFEGSPMTAVERSVLRYEHIRAGTNYVRLFGGNGQLATILDMVGLHHVMYNGEDSVVPSYPRLVVGGNQPFHARIAKTADFLSAILPRHYREDNWVLSPTTAIAHALAISGRELDPLAVRCYLTGTHDISPEAAAQLIEEFKHPKGQAGISDRKQLQDHIKRDIEKHGRFMELTSGWDFKRVLGYELETERLATKYGFPALAEVSPLSIKNKYADAA